MSENFQTSANNANSLSMKLMGSGNKYTIIFDADGTGLVDRDTTYHSQPVAFTHSVDVKALTASSISEDEREKYLTEYFWQNVNHTLEYPLWDYIWDRDAAHVTLHDQELEFERGNREEFDRLMQIFLLTETMPEYDDNFSNAVVRSATERNQPYLDRRWFYHSERLQRLVQLALEQHRPVGFVYEYDDNGYDLAPHSLKYDLYEIVYDSTPREQMAARAELRQWLLKLGQNPAEYGLEDWEKITE